MANRQPLNWVSSSMMPNIFMPSRDGILVLMDADVSESESLSQGGDYLVVGDGLVSSRRH
jgi:hypothetical protein